MTTALVQRAAVGLIEVCGGLMEQRDVATNIQRDVDLLMHLPSTVFAPLALPVANAVKTMTSEKGNLIRCTSAWSSIFSLLELLGSNPQVGFFGRPKFSWRSSLLSVSCCWL